MEPRELYVIAGSYPGVFLDEWHCPAQPAALGVRGTNETTFSTFLLPGKAGRPAAGSVVGSRRGLGSEDWQTGSPHPDLSTPSWDFQPSLLLSCSSARAKTRKRARRAAKLGGQTSRRCWLWRAFHPEFQVSPLHCLNPSPEWCSSKMEMPPRGITEQEHVTSPDCIGSRSWKFCRAIQGKLPLYTRGDVGGSLRPMGIHYCQ